MKKLQKLFKSKGFTLVECVVAIAVFAVLTLMVLMILSGTEQTSRNASKSEADLNNLVQNVVADDTNKKYGVDSHTLNMKFGTAGKPFSISYSVVDGYKNYVVCPNGSCGYIDNNIEFMANDVKTASAQYNADIAANYDWLKDTRLSHWFDVDTMQYVCPKCGHAWVENQLQCQSCLTEGTVRDHVVINGSTVHKFIFNNETGSFTCALCGSGSVKEKNLDKAITADSALYVSGISANAIRYGKIEQLEDEEAKELITMNGAANNNFRCTINYIPSANNKIPGKYKMKLDYITLEDDETADITITLPGSYICKLVSTSTNANGVDDHASVAIQQSAKLENPEKTSAIYISNIKRSNVGTGLTLEFTFTNYMNNATFDYDYSTESTGGLSSLVKYWFKSNNSTIALPRTDLTTPPSP